MIEGTNIVERIREHPHLKWHVALAICQLAILVWVTWFGAHVPSIDFAVDVDHESGAIYVTETELENPSHRQVQPGDVILAIDDRPVDSRIELYDALAQIDDEEVDVTVRRFDVPYQMTFTRDKLVHGELPAGVREDDLAVGIACQPDGARVELKAVDLEALQHLVRERATDEQGLLVFFRRPTDEDVVAASVEQSEPPWPLAALLLAGIGLIIVIVTQSARRVSWVGDGGDTRDIYLSLLVVLASLAAVGLAAGPPLASQPLLLLATAVGIALFKPIDLEYHLRERSSWSPVERFTRLAIYIAPVIFLAQIVFYGLGLTRMWWGNDIGLQDELRLDRLWLMLAATAGLLILVDALLMLVRSSRTDDEARISLTGSRIGLGFSAMFVLASVYLYVNADSSQLAGYAMSAAFVSQLLGNIVSIVELPRTFWRPAHDEALAPAPVVRFLRELSWLFPDDQVWLVVARTAFDDDMVRVRLPVDDEHAPEPLVRDLAPIEWVDLIDLLETEGGTIPRAAAFAEDDDPVAGIAVQLGIELAWPIARGVAGTSARAVMIVERPRSPAEINWRPSTMAEMPAAQLDALVATFDEVAPALVFQASAMLPVAPPVAAPPLPADDDAPPAATAGDEEHATPPPSTPAPSTAPARALAPTSSPAAEVPSAGHEADALHAEVAAEELARLQAQVRALEADLQRLHPVGEAETTPAQKDAAAHIDAGGTPVVLVGEPGVGKALVAHMVHDAHDGGAFVRLRASQIPPSVQRMELLGDEGQGGRLVASCGGTLLIEGADQLTDDVIHDLLAAVDAQEADEAPRVIFAIDRSSHEDADDRHTTLAEATGAAVVSVPPLRDQLDALPDLVDYFVHRAAMRHRRLVTGIADDVLEALRHHDWPGNFRELRDVLERAVLVCGERRTIAVRDLQLDFGLGDAPSDPSLREELDRLRIEHASRESELSSAREALAALQAELASLRAQVAEAERGGADAERGVQRDELASRVDELEAERDSLRERVDELRAQIDSLEGRIDELERDREQLTEELAQARADAATPADATSVDAVFARPYEEVEAHLLSHALERAEGNKSQAARDLGLKRSTFINKLKKYDLA